MNTRNLLAFTLATALLITLSACSGGQDLSALQAEIPSYNSSSVLKVPPKQLEKQYKRLNELNYGPLRSLDMSFSKLPQGASNVEITERQQTLDEINAKRSAVQEQMKIIKNGLAEQPVKMFKF